jgi:hypothetical protein
MHTSVLVNQIPYELCTQCQTFAMLSVKVAVEVCLERSSSTDIPSVLETLKPFVGLRLDWGINTKYFFKRSVCFRSRLAQFEAQFDANPSLLHISHFSMSIWSQNNTNVTSQSAQKKHTRSHSKTPLARLVHIGYSSRYLVAHKCTTSGFLAAFQFQGFLGSISYTRLGSFSVPFFSVSYFRLQPY